MSLKKLMVKILGRQHPHEKVVEVFSRFGSQGKLLDAPAGLGEISQKLKDAGFDVVAADVNPHLFCGPGIRCEKANLNEDLPFLDASFDFILCANGIEHLEDPFHFVRECFRVLKERGKLLITTPNIFNLKSRVAYVLVGWDHFKEKPCNEVEDYEGGHHIHLANYYELRINLHRNGFRIIEATTHQFSHTAMALFFLYPMVYLMTHRGFRRETNPMQKGRNEEILKHILSADLIFGKKLFLLAEKDPGYIKGRNELHE